MQFFRDEHFSWGILAVESIVIMLSVLLGFMLNSWRISQQQQATVDTALRSIAAEMRLNKLELEDHLPRYETISDTLQQLAKFKGAETPMKSGEIPGSNGFSIPILRPSAFETARSTGALSNTDYDLANHLFAYYHLIELYNGFLNQITNGLISNEFKTIKDWLLVYTVMENNGSIILQDRFDDILKQLSKEYNMSDTETDSARAKPTEK